MYYRSSNPSKPNTGQRGPLLVKGIAREGLGGRGIEVDEHPRFRVKKEMTEVLPSRRHYPSDNTDSDDYSCNGEYTSDESDSDDFVGNPSSPLIHTVTGVSEQQQPRYHQHHHHHHHQVRSGGSNPLSTVDYEGHIMERGGETVVSRHQNHHGSGNGAEVARRRESDHERAQRQLSMLALMLAAFRRSLLTCRAPDEECSMDIGWPTNVQHVAHVTFDRYNGFLGLPVEFEVEVPRRVPSASASVFGVSAESMQCSYDAKGNSVPTILLLMQEALYIQGGMKVFTIANNPSSVCLLDYQHKDCHTFRTDFKTLLTPFCTSVRRIPQVEGIFRINAESIHEEHARKQLNKGIVPNDIDLHCLAGLIKAWFRELPRGVLDSLSPEQVMQCHTEEQCVELVKLLPPTQAALLDWAVNLMADVAQEEQVNKMNARNIAMVFAPNMTQMADPLTALMHAVQVMNFLKTLILRTLRDREDVVLDARPASAGPEAPDTDGHNNESAGAIPNGYHESEPVVETPPVQYQEYCIVVPKKRGKGKAKGGRLVNTIDQTNERVEAW